MSPEETGHSQTNRHASASSAVDAATLAELRSLGHDALRTLIPLFVEDSATRVGRLRSGLLDGPPGGLAPIAHSLTGSCASFGAHVLADLCTELELRCRSAADGVEVSGLVDAIDVEFGRVRDTLARQL
jgi:HPt (histidine-containing phosphotransfer) domain-containing protein